MKKKLFFVATLFAGLAFSLACVAQTPSITTFSPSSGSVGTLITITGTNLQRSTAFTVGGVSAIVVSDTSVIPANYGDTLVGMVMPNSVTGAVSITTTSGTANSTSNFSITPTSYPSVQQGAKLVGTGVTGSYALQGTSVSVSADGNTAIVGGYYDNSGQGAVWVYIRSGGVWMQQGTKLVGTGGTGYQGYSVSLSADGNTAIVGGFSDSANTGAVWVFVRIGDVWMQQGAKLVGIGSSGTAEQGTSVSVSADGNTAIEGGVGDWSSGAAWVFTRKGSVWTQQGSKLVGTGASESAGQGTSVSLSADGNTALIGGEDDSNGVGAAWVFTSNGGVWTQQGSKLVGTGGVYGIQGEEQGTSVSLSADGNTAIVGGGIDNFYSGAAWVYTRSGDVWSQQGNKLVGVGTVGDTVEQGSSVSLSADGNTAMVGGVNDNNSAGAVWVFTRIAGVWMQQGNKLIGTGAVGIASQGRSVSLSADGNTSIVGGYYDNSGQGAAWVFTSSPTGVENYSSSTDNINIYPIPNDGHFQISFTGLGYQSITIYNEIGKKISEQLLDEKNANISLQLNLAEYPSGIYFAQILTSHGEESKKILIQK